MSKKSQDTRLKQQDCWKSLEKLVPPLELCQQIDIDCFNKSAMVWWADYNGVEIIVIPRTFVSRKEEIVAPAPTLAEIMGALPKNVEYQFFNGKFLPCHPKFDEDDFADEKPEDAALKLWLELNKSDLSDQSDQSDTDRKGGEQ
ncbi:MAG: hypothetical protein IJH79_19820 [Lentisphaeria bacterium]|nr:hypothetical protein [Lentisphaeria bacterium]